MSPQQDADGQRRPRANTTAFPSISSWLRDRQTPTTPTLAPLPPSMSLEALIEALTPPNQPSLAHARLLACLLQTHSPIPRPSALSSALVSLCSVKAPVSLQAAGYEIINAYHENNEVSAFETTDRLAYLSLFLGPSIDWSQELWEPRFRALRALTNYGTEIFGLESAFLEVLQTWIQGAFAGLLSGNLLDPMEHAERQRTFQVVAQFLTEVVGQPAVAARLRDEELATTLQFYAGLVDQAICTPLHSSSSRRGIAATLLGG